MLLKIDDCQLFFYDLWLNYINMKVANIFSLVLYCNEVTAIYFSVCILLFENIARLVRVEGLFFENDDNFQVSIKAMGK